MSDSETLRLAPPVIFWWVWVAFVVANVADYAAQGLPSARFGAVVGAVLLLGTGLAFTLALRPRVTADADGITVVNPYRTHVVPWRLVTSVDTSEWVRVHYALSGTGDAVSAGGDGARAFAAPSPAAASGAWSRPGSGKVDCWALYVSARARRKIAGGPPRPRDPLSGGSLGRLGLGLGLGRWGGGRDEPGAAPGYASYSRLPDEARYLASLPPAKAMALRLDSRANRERARPEGGASPPQAAVSWSWPAVAAVVLPAIVLLTVALA